MSMVVEAWSVIEEWLARHAPSCSGLLGPPASPASIAAAEAAVGDFPADLVTSLRRHDGLLTWANILPSASPLPVAKIAENWRMCMEIAEEPGPPNSSGEPWWHPLWIPWAMTAGGDFQVLDVRPGPSPGRLGWAVHDDGGQFEDAWPSLGAYLTEVASALRGGGEVGGLRPYLTADGALWWSGTTSLNGAPLRPAPHL